MVVHVALLMAHQLRAARAVLRLEQEQLAEAAGVALSTIRRLEAQDGEIRSRTDTVRRVERALEAAGVVFTARGVELREQPAEAQVS
jgi:predicted transcriptional regulator